MKKLLLTLLFLATFGAYTQEELWPVSNSEWYYTMTDYQWSYGYSHYKIERDTTIQGRTCQIYSFKSKWKFTGLPWDTVYNKSKDIQFIIQLQDSILHIYDQEQHKFDTVINFKAELGNVWRTYFYDEHCRPQQGSQYIVTEVVEKGVETINGKNLLKLKLKRTTPTNEYFFEDFYQLFGGNGNFVYNKVCYASDFSSETELRCFLYHTNQSDSYIYKGTELDCESISSLNTTNIEEQPILVLYPNPSEDVFYISSELPISNIQVLDLNSRNISFVQTENTIDLANNPSGIYFVSFEINGNKHFQKLIKK